MTFQVIVEADAKQDWIEAVDWYEEREPGVGWRLNDEILSGLKTLATQPERFRLVTRLTRRLKVTKPWPYSLYFTVNAGHREVRVLAIWHGARSPARLRRRLK